MDEFLLQAAVGELRREAVGLPVHRVVSAGPDRTLLLLGDGWGEGNPSGTRRRLLLSLEPDRPLLQLTWARTGPAPAPTPFQSALRRDLEGGQLAGIDKTPWQRAVRLRFAGADGSRELALELFGRRPNAVLLGADGAIGAFHHPARDLEAGGRYLPPDPGGRPDPTAVDGETFEALAAQGIDGLGRRLARSVLGFPPTLADDLERGARAGLDPWPRFRDWRDRAAAGRFDLRLYRSAGGEGPPVLAAFPLQMPPAGASAETFAVPSEALDAWREAGDAERRLEDRRASLLAPLARERRRLEKLEEKLAADLARGDESEELNRLGSALLAGLSHAEVRGGRAIVPDPYGAPGASLEIPLDPKRSLQDNAQALFRRAKKVRRGRGTIAARLEEVRARLPRLREAESRAAAAGAAEELESLEDGLGRDGLLRLVRREATRRRPAAPGRAAEVLPIRSYTSKDGYEVLMGRTGKENDLLTFRVASPHDFWFHAQGYAGAHVVVRNPERLGNLPRATLEQAAMLAAFHSKARGAGRVDVIVTQRRHVRKGRGMPAGMVQVRRHETVRVAPEMPFANGEV